jgi:hypothetical protein
VLLSQHLKSRCRYYIDTDCGSHVYLLAYSKYAGSSNSQHVTRRESTNRGRGDFLVRVYWVCLVAEILLCYISCAGRTLQGRICTS